MENHYCIQDPSDILWMSVKVLSSIMYLILIHKLLWPRLSNVKQGLDKIEW